MALIEAFNEVVTAFDTLLSATQNTVLSRLEIQSYRLSNCEQNVQDAMEKTIHRYQSLCQRLKQDSVKHQAQIKTLQSQIQHERQERNEELTWIAELWPNTIVPAPTLLQSLMGDSTEPLKFISQVEDKNERRRLQALLNRRAAKERVLHQMEVAKQWKMIVVEPSVTTDGESIDGQTYYINTVTNESVWEAPVAMFYEPPTYWDHGKMDWKTSYGLEHFYVDEPMEEVPVKPMTPVAKKRVETKEYHSDSDVEEEEEEEEDIVVPLDPVVLRDQLTQELEHEAQIRQQLEQSQLQQRALSLQLLNTTRECFDRERQDLQRQDEEKKTVERKKRKEKQQEDAAVKAATNAAERRSSKSIQPRFSRDSVGKKDMALFKEDELFEQELEASILAQRADDLYLAAPLAKEDRVKYHKQYDEEYLHMKEIETLSSTMEQTEFDLIEKSSLRHEEGVNKCDTVRARYQEIQTKREALESEMMEIKKTIERVETSIQEPKESKPSVEDVEKARLMEESKEETSGMDQEEMERLRHCIQVDREWWEWEQQEIVRLETLASSYDRYHSLETTQRQLVLDATWCEADLHFFEQVTSKEQELNAMLWRNQGASQIERIRFMIERATREESMFQVEDEYKSLQIRLEEAYTMPLQARNEIEQLELITTSQTLAQTLQTQIKVLQQRYAKEQAAQVLLRTLEIRFYTYNKKKLQEEFKLLTEKQSLWDQNEMLHNELEQHRCTMEELCQQESLSIEDYQATMNQFDDKLRHLQDLRQFILLCYDRETRWRSLAAIALIKDTSSDEWMTSMQQERQDQVLALLEQQHREEIRKQQQEIKVLERMKKLFQEQVNDRDHKLVCLQHEYQTSLETTRIETEHIIKGLQTALQHEQKIRKEEQTRALMDRERLLKEHESIQQTLEQRISTLEVNDSQQWYWLTSVKRQLYAQRIANEELLMGYQSLEKRRATETNDARFRITSQIRKINHIEMWNLSLKLQAKQAHHQRLAMRQEIETLLQEHKQQQRRLRCENWKHRVTAQAILTNVDHLVLFFAQGLEILCGSTQEANDALRENGGIEILAVLAQHCKQSQVRVIASKALGEIVWNRNDTPRSVGWKAKHVWFTWYQTQSTRILQHLANQQLEFDSIAQEASSDEINWLADTRDMGETDHDLHSKTHKKIMFLRTWLSHEENTQANMNIANQEYIGMAPNVLKTLIDLCQPCSWNDIGTDTVTKIQQNALQSLAIIAMHTRNTTIVGHMDGCIPLLTRLMQNTTNDTRVVLHAIHALANLSYDNPWNQTQIWSHQAIPELVRFCNDHTDVDMIRASVHALRHLSFNHLGCCQAIFDANGITILTQLCHSYRIHDAVDLIVYEEIQSCAAEILSNVITMLDGEHTETISDQQEASSPTMDRNIIHAILNANETLITSQQTASSPGIATFVLMCASCNRDVAFHGALVLGSIAQHDEIRAAIGIAGGIDALFILTDRMQDPELVAQATWALANSTWNRENQYRIARYMEALYRICTFRIETPENDSKEEEVDWTTLIREHGLCTLANALFYNEANRELVASDAKWMSLFEHHCMHSRGLILEHSARALCSLSYSDAVALAMGSGNKFPQSNRPLGAAAAVNGLDLFVRMCGHKESQVVQKHGLYGIINMCLHDENKSRILEIPHGIEMLVNLSGQTNRELADAAMEALDLLADVRTMKERVLGDHSHSSAVPSPSTMSSLAANDLKKLIGILRDTNTHPELIAMASDAIADEVWKKPNAKVKLRNELGLEKLLDLCVDQSWHKAGLSRQAERRVLLSCLWALRNTIADNVRNQDYIGALDGIPRLLALYDRERREDDVVEGILAVFVSLVMKHPRNSQQLVSLGLDVLLPLAEGKPKDSQDEAEERLRESKGDKKKNRPEDYMLTRNSENAALARDLLQLVSPYNVPQLPPIATSPHKKSRHTATTQSQHVSNN